jgi:hypothetical protein
MGGPHGTLALPPHRYARFPAFSSDDTRNDGAMLAARHANQKYW